LTNILVVRVLGVAIFGEYVVLNTYIAIGGLIYILIPTSLAVFAYQDDKNFKNIYFSFFVTASAIYLIYLIIISSFAKTGGIIFIFYALTSIWINYYTNVVFQATKRLKEYFKILAYSAIGKVILITGFYFLKIMNTVDELLLSMALPQSVLLLLTLKKDETVSWKNFFVFKGVFVYLRINIKKFMPYYFNLALKRIEEQVPVLIFNSIVSKELLGIYTLFMKSIAFIVGLLRSVEAYFNNRDNINSHYKNFFTKAYLIGFITQIGFIVFTSIYIYIMLIDSYLIESIIASFFFLFYFKNILVRVKHFSNYQTKNINISEVLFIVLMCILSFTAYSMNSINIKTMLLIYVGASMFSQLYLILSSKTNKV
jgi:hypothetical protein